MLSTATRAFIHKEVYGKGKKVKKKSSTQKKPVKKLGKPKKQGY